MSESADSEVDYKESYFQCLEENEVLGEASLKYAKQAGQAEARLKKLRDWMMLQTGQYPYEHYTSLWCKYATEQKRVLGIDPDTWFFEKDEMMLDENGNRSVFDDVDA